MEHHAPSRRTYDRPRTHADLLNGEADYWTRLGDPERAIRLRTAASAHRLLAAEVERLTWRVKELEAELAGSFFE